MIRSLVRGRFTGWLSQAWPRSARLRSARSWPRFAYGSLTRGVDAWREKWDHSPGWRVLLYARKDFSGSFYKWAAAINEFTPFAARLVTFCRHPYGYTLDLLYSLPHDSNGGLESLAREADLLHVKDEEFLLTGAHRLPQELFPQLDRPRVFTHYGGYARKFKADPRYIEHVSRRFAGRVSMTPDLCFPWFEGSYIPHSIDLREFPCTWNDGIRVAHSPSTARRKGTVNFMRAVGGVAEELGIELDLIEGVSHQECLARKSRCNLFFDQAGRESYWSLGIRDVIGWYGNSALEAAAHGIPTMAHLSSEAFAGATRAGMDLAETCGILPIPRDVPGMQTALRDYFHLGAAERLGLSQRTRNWVEAFHGQEAVGSRLAAFYRTLL